MAKYYGKIGYEETVETAPSVWEEIMVEKSYSGDIYKNTRRLIAGDSVNSDVDVTMSISIIADPYAFNNFLSIRYAEYMGNKWKVTTATPEHPRIILTLGGLYNEQKQTET